VGCRCSGLHAAVDGDRCSAREFGPTDLNAIDVGPSAERVA
jgi:hypothetical protein